jgi:hypothetical protein
MGDIHRRALAGQRLVIYVRVIAAIFCRRVSPAAHRISDDPINSWAFGVLVGTAQLVL